MGKKFILRQTTELETSTGAKFAREIPSITMPVQPPPDSTSAVWGQYVQALENYTNHIKNLSIMPLSPELARLINPQIMEIGVHCMYHPKLDKLIPIQMFDESVKMLLDALAEIWTSHADPDKVASAKAMASTALNAVKEYNEYHEQRKHTI